MLPSAFGPENDFVHTAYTEKLGRRKAVQKLIQTFLLSTEFVYRNEFGIDEPDEHGRRMMAPRDASYALAYALNRPESGRGVGGGRAIRKIEYPGGLSPRG